LETLFDVKRGVSVTFEDGATYEYVGADWTKMRKIAASAATKSE
jgi:hypothetical protein